MIAARLLHKLKSMDVSIYADKGILHIESANPLTDKQLDYLKRHKPEILKYLVHLQAASIHSAKHHAYRFQLSNGKGGGTYITTSGAEEAREELIARFSQYDFESFSVAGETAH